MTQPTLASLLVQEDKATIYEGFLSIAQTLGLPVTSWQAGDPTRSLGYLEATLLETLENVAVGYIQSGFLDYATGVWLTVVAQQVFNVTVPPATYATTSVTLTNAGGGIYTINPGDLTFKASATGATYHNTSGGTLTGVGTPGATLTVTVTADIAGSASSASATQIDTLVTTLLGVTCTNPTAAVGIDQQAPSVTVQQCRNKLGSLSPNGPASAYSYVALNSALTGIQTPTRCRVYPDSTTGIVQVYVAGASGALSGSDVTAVQTAIQQWAAPLCITPIVATANNNVVNVTYTLWLYQSVNQTSAQVQAAVSAALATMFANRPIGGDIIPPATTGAIYQSLIQATIENTYPTKTFRVSLTSPSGDTAAANGDVPVLGTVTGTINFVTDPK